MQRTSSSRLSRQPLLQPHVLASRRAFRRPSPVFRVLPGHHLQAASRRHALPLCARGRMPDFVGVLAGELAARSLAHSLRICWYLGHADCSGAPRLVVPRRRVFAKRSLGSLIGAVASARVCA